MQHTIYRDSTAESPGSLRQVAIAEIRHRIITGEFTAETVFSESMLSEMLGISKAPVREALIVLNQLGWVTTQPRSGYLVSPMTLGDLQELFGMRSLLEPRAAFLAARNAGTPHLMTGPLEDFVKTEDDPASPEWLDAHYRYHRRIIIGSNNRELDRTLSETHLKLKRYFTLTVVHDALTTDPIDHRSLTAAILTGDSEAAWASAVRHVSQAQLQITEAILSSDGIRQASLPLSPRSEQIIRLA